MKMKISRGVPVLTTTCYFCDRDIPVDEEADNRFDILGPREWACWASGHLEDLDDLCPWTSVCVAGAERLAGPDWLEKGRAAIAASAE